MGWQYRNLGHIELDRNPKRALELYDTSLNQFAALAREFPSNAVYRREHATSLMCFVPVLQRLNRTKEAIDDNRQAVALMQEVVVGDARAVSFRQDLFQYQISLASLLTTAGTRQDAADALKEVMAGAEQLLADRPLNSGLPFDKVTLAHWVGAEFASLGDLSEALEVLRNSLKFHIANQKNTAAFWDAAGFQENSIASLQLRLGKREDAEKSLRSALEMYQRSRQLAESAGLAQQHNSSALLDLGFAHYRVAFVSEQLGDLPQSFRSWRDAFHNAEALLGADPTSAGYKSRLAIRRSQAIRLLWLMEGERGDYRQFLDGDPSPRRVRMQIAIAWMNMARDRQEVLSPISLRVAAIEKALELDRALAAEEPQVSVQVSLAADLEHLATFRGEQARLLDGAERNQELEKQRAALVESRSIFNALKEAGTLPKENSGAIVALTKSITAIEAQMSGPETSR